MTDLPSFRPRAALGYADPNGMVRPSREFLQFLDLFVRQTDTNTTATTGAEAFTPVSASGSVSAALGGGLQPVSAQFAATTDVSPVSHSCAISEGLDPV